MRRIPIGTQDFDILRERNCFYIDKTDFLTEWWNYGSEVTAIMRPRRFGKTLTCSMVKSFFSLDYADRGEELFGDLKVWQDKNMRGLQGKYPVIFLSFASLKSTDVKNMLNSIRYLIGDVFSEFNYLLSSGSLTDADKDYFLSIRDSHKDVTLEVSLNKLSKFLAEHHDRKPIIILDEYDTPMQEAYMNGYWNELAGFMRHFFNATFKTNSHLERGLMTGITRIAKESIFSDLNHLESVTMLSDEYADSFGFTEEEVFAAMDEYGLTEKAMVKKWYDGFIIGKIEGIYNPWSIINYLKHKGKLFPYWSNTSSNELVSSLIRKADPSIKENFEILLQGGSIKEVIDPEIVFNRLKNDARSIWSILMNSGYLTGSRAKTIDYGKLEYNLHITNFETRLMFYDMFSEWFLEADCRYNDFLKAILQDDIEAMNAYINKISSAVFSSFDSGNKPSEAEPERFYHGFVLGLMVDLRDRYIMRSNRESGFGRYDVMLEPIDKEKDNGIILEFKVHNPKKESSLEDTAKAALMQIAEKKYAADLINRGVPEDRIKSYGFAFQGKKVLIDRA